MAGEDSGSKKIQGRRGLDIFVEQHVYFEVYTQGLHIMANSTEYLSSMKWDR